MKKLLVVACVFVALGAWAYNLIPGLKVPPNPKERRACEGPLGEGYYRWDITTHGWNCSDNWIFPGIHGV